MGKIPEARGMRPIPTMNIVATKNRLIKCAKRECDDCAYCNTFDCRSRLMLEASHALLLLLEERELGMPLRVEEGQT